MKWSDDQIDVVAHLLRKGLSAREIGKVVCRSNGWIVGLVHRTPRLTEIGFANPAPVMKTRKQVERDLIEERLRRQGNGEIIIGLATVRTEKTLMELTSAQCRFPVLEDPLDGKHLFCAETREDDSSYCAIHRKLCRANPRTIQPREKEPQL